MNQKQHYKWSQDLGIVDNDGYQIVQIYSCGSKAERTRTGKLLVSLLNSHCEPDKNGKPKMTKP